MFIFCSIYVYYLYKHSCFLRRDLYICSHLRHCPMRSAEVKEDVIQMLQEQVLAMQGLKKPGAGNRLDMGLGKIEMAFPGGVFPIGGVHEFISRSNEDATATNGFISGLLGRFMQNGGVSVWVSMRRTIFPVALKFF